MTTTGNGTLNYAPKNWPKYFQTKNWRKLGADHPIIPAAIPIFRKACPRFINMMANGPQAFWIFDQNRPEYYFHLWKRPGDGWEDPAVQTTPKEVRLMALQMGARIISYVLKSNIWHQRLLPKYFKGTWNCLCHVILCFLHKIRSCN